MERVKADRNWSLFCPRECPNLDDVYGSEFNALYAKYEAEGRAKKVISARILWFQILDAQMETGTPYLLYKDSANSKSNQKNVGTIKSSNLCSEIIEYSDKDETAVCNLASIALPVFVNKETGVFDYNELIVVAKIVADNLNKIIDINYYPTEQTRTSNMRHRPIGVGVQGLADTFIMMGVAFHSEEAKKINKLIFETIYFAVLTKSNELAMQDGPYSTFAGSPASNGILQFDMWKVVPDSDRYDWTTLKQSIQTHGLRNSLLVALMPTAGTSQILGYNECFEPLTSNIYSRRTLAGEFVVANQYLMRELIELGIWNDQIKNNIIENKGSIQQITSIPQYIRDKYKIVWEIPMKHIIDMSADRGAYVCQSQSLNLWMEDPNYTALTSMHFYAWKQGLKTGMYYLRRKAKHQAQQFTIEPTKPQPVVDEIGCEMCSS
jgi:ribonucleoside-diphosphate reductase alpha chain